MPLHARLYVNHDELDEAVHIGRLEGGVNPSDLNTYIIVVGVRPDTYEDWLEGVRFTHRYGDGAVKCFQLGLSAYFEAQKKGMTNE